MTEAAEFRLYAREAMNWSLGAKGVSEKRALTELGCTWAYAAIISERLGRVERDRPRRPL
jgi:hypothetical protein